MSPKLSVIVASENGRKGAIAGMKLLRKGGSALDAVELACRVTEDDPEEHTVGYSGIPNILGQVELDASLMDGHSLRTGAVAGVRDYANAITLARRVMDETPHVLLVGRGAERLAAEVGQPPADQRTFTALERWRARFDELGVSIGQEPLRKAAEQMTRPLNLTDRPEHGTVNFLARDSRGHLASGVSTSGLGWKYPGRVGDSPLIGAGNYCDDRYGAAACTGMGEMAIRVSTARSFVLYCKMGMSLAEAGNECLHELMHLPQVPGRYMNFVCLAPDGGHGGFSTVTGKRYLHISAEMDEPELLERRVVSQG